MGGKNRFKVILLALALLGSAAVSSAQGSRERTDSLVRLMQAKSLELLELHGQNYRKAVDATFLHNGTYLICDTALWNVDSKVINSWGHVKLMQEETELTSDKLDYYIDDDLAQFRGTVVQMRNKLSNILRTRNLDYNTKDSLATFRGGAAMRDSDGQIIESDYGTYESATKLFTFRGNVNMFTDSVFVRTTSLTYDADRQKANFNAYIDFWQDGNMLSASGGWYDRGAETFFFRRNVHGQTTTQECWSDSLYFYRGPQDVLMLGNAQVKDSTRNVTAMANYLFYQDSLQMVTMRNDAAVALRTEQDSKIDTLYFGADDLSYWTKKMCDIPESEVKHATDRMTEMSLDPVREYRRKAAEEAAKAAAEAAKNDPNARPVPKTGTGREDLPGRKNDAAAPGQGSKAAVDSLQHPDSLRPPQDSLGVMDSLAVTDSLSAADSLALLPPPDTTKIGFLKATGNVRIFRQDMQVRCDSLRYCDLDSIARFYKEPIVWNEGNRQYTSDSLAVLVKNGGVDRASLMSNAFIITQEDTICFDQIKGTDVMAYFDDDSNLSRFDALGGATALFFLEEEGSFATVNKVESKMLSANLVKGEVERVFYFDSPKNDAYPVVQMPETDRRMKGFNWMPERRPKSKDDITTLELKPSERSKFDKRPKAKFKQTEIYFPGYMDKVYKDIEASRERKQRQREISDSLAAVEPVEVPDTLAAETVEIPAYMDSTASVVPAVADSIAVGAGPVVEAAQDTTAAEVHQPTAAELKALERQRKAEERETARALKIARRDARWAEMDAKDKAKKDAKDLKKLEKKRVRTRKSVIRQRRQDIKDERKLQRYIDRFEKRSLRRGGPRQVDEPEIESTLYEGQQIEQPESR